MTTLGSIVRGSAGDSPPLADASSSAQDAQSYTQNYSSQAELQGFSSNTFVKPKDFTRKSREATRQYNKRPLLGPDAKDARKTDLFYQLNIDPLDECENSALMSDFVTDMGRIKPRSQTQLTWRNQRRIGKAIRRAKMMGIIPILSKRPLVKTLHN